MSSTVLIRVGSFFTSPMTGGVNHSVAGDSFLRRNTSSLHSPRCRCAAAIHLETESGRKGSLLRRARADLAGPNRSPPIPEKVVEEEEDDLVVKWCDLGMSVPAGLAGQMEYSGGGTGKGKNVGRGWSGGDGDRDDNRRISDYYQQMSENCSSLISYLMKRKKVNASDLP